jgi:hypothetical protein
MIEASCIPSFVSARSDHAYFVPTGSLLQQKFHNVKQAKEKYGEGQVPF